MKREIRFVVPKDKEGMSLIDFLASRFPFHTREAWLEQIAQKRVEIDGRTAEADYGLVYRDAMVYTADDIPEPPARLDVEVVHDDRDILVVNKPPNLPCHPGGRYFHHTLWAVLKTRHGIESPALVNRLDRETSGLTVVAKNPEAARKCRTQFNDRRVEKRYIVLVEGSFPDTLHAAGYLTPAREGHLRKPRTFVQSEQGAGEPPGGEWAETLFRRLDFRDGLSEVEALPKTGRMHQIRATLHSLGFPVVGDKTYGVDPSIFLRFCTDSMTEDDRRRLRMDRQALHAAGLRFRHPRTGADLQFDLPLPSDMATLLTPIRVKEDDARII